MGQPTTQRHSDVTSQSIVAAEVNTQVSVGIKFNLEVAMGVRKIFRAMCNIGTTKIKALLVSVACVSCLLFAPLTRGYK